MTDLDPPPIDLLDGIMTTRALRRYTDEPVSDNDLWTILRAAQQGPSGGNIQPWQFVVVTDDEPKAKLGELGAHMRARATTPDTSSTRPG